MRPLTAFLMMFMLAGCDSKSAASETGARDSEPTESEDGICEPDYDAVQCCDAESGELSTCCCYEEECEEVMDFTINDDGSCTQTVNS